MAARLKVFGWSDGFHSWTVATSSRPKALQAWNVQQDLFKSGLAHEVEAGPERDAALASPGTVIKTGLTIDPGVIKALKPDRLQADRRAARAKVDAIKAQIEALDTALADEVRALYAESATLAKRIADIEADGKRKRVALQRALDKART